MPDRRRLRYVPFGVGLLTGAAICWVRSHMDQVLKDSFQIVLAAGLGLYAMIVLMGFSLVWALAAILWRCSHCRRIINLSFSGNFCGSCGREIQP